MRCLTDELCRAELRRDGLVIRKHAGNIPDSYWYEADLVDGATYSTTERVIDHQAAYNLVDCLLLQPPELPEGWILWLNGQVFDNDCFVTSLFNLLNRECIPDQSRLCDGYFFEVSERSYCITFTALVMVAGWDAIIAGVGGSVALTLENDGRMIYKIRRATLSREPVVLDYLNHFSFREEET